MEELLVRYLRGEVTAAEADQVDAWLSSSVENRATLDALARISALARATDDRVDPLEPPPARMLISLADAPAQRRGEAPRRSLSWRAASVAVAATAVLASLATAGYQRLWPGGDARLLATEELSTGPGEATTVRLSDGSVVRLGPSSRLQMMEQGSGRQVVLSGRAFFAVAPDKKRPFRVHTPSGTIRVLGTRFQVEAGSDDMRLVVVEGAVALATSGSEVQLKAGEMTSVRLGQPAVVEQAPGLSGLSPSWMGQFLVFQRTPLAAAAQEIAELYGVEVQVLDANLAEKTLTMWFSSRPLDEVLTVVCSVVDAACVIEDGSVTIGPRK